MIEWFFLYRIDAETTGPSISGENNLIAPSLPHETEPALSFMQLTASGAEVAGAQMAAFRDWEQFTGRRFADLKRIGQPTLVVNGIHDEMIPVANSYSLSENLPNAVLLTYPDSGHGSLFQFHDSFTRQAAAFLASDSPSAAY